jgi:hypothetical protein
MLKQENNENEQKTKCGKNIDQSRKKIKNTLAYTHKYTKHLTNFFEIHYKYITKAVFEFFSLLARRKIGLLLNFYFPKETLILGRGKFGQLPYSNV